MVAISHSAIKHFAREKTIIKEDRMIDGETKSNQYE